MESVRTFVLCGDVDRSPGLLCGKSKGAKDGTRRVSDSRRLAGSLLARFFIVLIISCRPYCAWQAFQTARGGTVINDYSPFLCLICPVLAIVNDEI